MAELVAGDIQGRDDASQPLWRGRRWLLATAGVLVLAFFALLSYGLWRNPGQEVGGTVPLSGVARDFRATTLDGKPLGLAEHRGQVVVINFWGSWCVPCAAESAELNRTYQRYQDRGVVFIGIAWADQEGEARKFVQKYAVPYPTALDSEARIAVDYGITGVPETFLIDREGRLVEKWVGPVTTARLSGLIDPLLR